MNKKYIWAMHTVMLLINDENWNAIKMSVTT